MTLHGFVCNRGLWNPWWPRLRAAGVPCIALDLEPVFGSIDGYVPQIDAAVRRLSEATGQPPLLVARSLGGLAVRAWLRRLANSESTQRYPRFTCFCSHCDHIVFPCSSATLPGADNRHLRGQAHVQLLQHPAVFDEVLRRLQEDAAPQPGANSRSPGSTTPASICGQARTSA